MKKDFTLALRALLKTPAFTAMAILTLALGIGLNTAMFSLMNVTLLRPLPFERSDELMRLYRSTSGEAYGGLSAPDLRDLREAGSAVARFAAFRGETGSLSEPGRPAELRETLAVSPNYFDVLRAPAELGRTFGPDDDKEGNRHVVILSHALWQERFAADPRVLGRTISIDREPYQVVGVLPAWVNDERFVRQAALFRPLWLSPKDGAARDQAGLNVFGRRLPGVGPAAAEAFVRAEAQRLAAAFPKEDGGATLSLQNLKAAIGNNNGKVIVSMLLGLSGVVLLIACTNLANFLLARALARSHELAVRGALGASRLRLIRPMAFESLLLAAAGCAGALLVSVWGADWLSARSVESGGGPMTFPLDWRVLSFAASAAALTALVFGVAPSWFATRLDLNRALRVAGRGATPSAGHQRLRRILVIGQFAMAMMLLAGAGYFARGSVHLLGRHVGWDSANVIEGAFDLPAARYANREQVLAFHRRVLDRLAQLPGVEAASLSYSLPYTGTLGPRGYVVEGSPRPAKGQEPTATFNAVSPDYFKVTATRLLSGRAISAADTPTSPPVVVISESLARALFGAESPLGRRLARADDEKPVWAQVVGVAQDTGTFGIYRKETRFQVYHPLAQDPWNYATVGVRMGPGQSAFAPEGIPAALAALDPDLPLRDFMSADRRLELSAMDVTMLEKMLGAFALLGLFLAAIGIYGMIERSVVQRSAEIGIRMALGARTADVLRLILASGMRLAFIGAALGILGAMALGQLVRSIMPAMVTDGEAVTAAGACALLAVALLACFLPARRVARVDPLVILRGD